MLCKRCNKEFNGYPAISRKDKSKICPLCGHREALEDSVSAGAMSYKHANEILDILKSNYENCDK